MSPGIPDGHPVFAAAAAAGVQILDESDLADRWDARPRCAVTGTNGKTTTTLMLAAMLRAAGLRTVAAGNIGVSMVEVVMAEATPEGALDAIAV